MPRRSGGRPTRGEAEARDRRLLQIATRMFEERGFEGTTMDALAEAAGVGKPTVYARFKDKSELFGAVFRHRVDSLLGPLVAEAERLAEGEAGGAVETLLHAIGTMLLRHALSEDSIRLHRIVLSTAGRFPELAALIQTEGWSRTVDVLARLLRGFVGRGILAVDDETEAADMFLSIVLGRLQRTRMLGLGVPDDAALARRVRRATTLFLDGTRR